MAAHDSDLNAIDSYTEEQVAQALSDTIRTQTIKD